MRATRQDNFLAIIIILGIFATLGLRIWASHHAGAIYGPTLVAANRQSAYVVMNDHLYHLDPSGTVQDAVSLDSIGFSDSPCDMQAIEDGRLLIGNRRTRAIHACDADLRSCWPLYSLPAVQENEKAGRFEKESGFDFFFETATDRLFIVDAVLNAFSIVSLSDGNRNLVLDKEDLSFPNAIWVDHSGTARIAETAQQRIAGVLTESSRFKAFYTDFETRTDVSRGGNYFPIDLIQEDGDGWWVINAGPRLRSADLVRYDADGAPLERIALPNDADPQSLALFGNRLLVAAPAQFALISIDLEDGTVGSFGSQPFMDEAAYFRQRAAAYRNISGLAMICLVLFVLFCGALTWKVYFMGKKTGDRRLDRS